MKRLLLGGLISLLFISTACTSGGPEATVTAPEGLSTSVFQPVTPDETTPPQSSGGTTTPAETVEVEEVIPTATATATETVAATTIPEGQGLSPTTLTSIYMQDETTGWALTEQQVMRTEDGGQTWTDVSPAGGFSSGTPLHGFFLDSNTGWVMASDPQNPEVGMVYRTQDGGAAWQSASVPFGFGLLFFLDAQTGWTMVDRGAGAGSQAVEIYRSADGGQGWERLSGTDPDNPDSPGVLPFSGIKSGLSFSDLEHGWLGGSVPMDNFIYLYSTSDGGVTWQHQEPPLPEGYENAQTSVDPPRFFTPQDGVLPVRVYSGNLATVFYVTQDGGSTWVPTSPAMSGGMYSVASMQDFFIWGESGLSVSHDGGSTWNTLAPDTNLYETLVQLDFVSATTGWALSMDANGTITLFRTQDGGATWLKVSD